MTAAPRPRTLRPRLRPDRSWRLRQLTGSVFVLWFAVAVPLGVAAWLVEPRWVGWAVAAWFVVLVAFMIAVRVADARMRGAWRRVVAELGWEYTAADPSRAARWPFPPFTLDPAPEVLDVTSGRYRGRQFSTGRFRYVAGRRRLGFDFLDLEVDRPLPPLQVLPRSLTSLAAPEQSSAKLNSDLPGRYRLVRGEEELALAVLHPRAAEALLKVPPFGFTCEGRRFVAVLPGYRDSRTSLAHLDAACDLLDLVPEQVWQAGEQWAASRD